MEMLLRLLTARRRCTSLILLCAALAACGLTLVVLLLPATSTGWTRSTDLHYQVALETLLLGNASARPTLPGPAVPHIVHQSWKGRKLPTARAERWSASWVACFPDWEWRLWTDEDNLELIRRHYDWFLPVYLGYQKPIERADLARYFYMHRYGGVYADLDAMCLRNFTHLLQSAGVIFSGMDYDQSRTHEMVQGTYVQNSFMASRPGHPFWLRLALRAMRLFYQHQGRSRQDTRPEYLTGPFLLMDELRQHYRDSEKLEGSHNDIVIYPGKYFNPFSWSVNKNPACKHLGGMTQAEEKACIASFHEAYVIQFHTQSWLKGRL